MTEFIRANPGVAVSLSYLLLTLCGVFYASTFYDDFDVPILKLADISDLLIAGISEPAALLLFCSAVIVGLSFDWMFRQSYHIEKRWREKPAGPRRALMMAMFHTPKTQFSAVSTIIMGSILYAFVFVAFYTEWQSRQISRGDGHKVEVRTENRNQPETRMLLGSTANYLITYDIEEKRSYVIPIEQVISVKPVVDKKEDTE